MPDLRAFLGGGGQVAELIRHADWSGTSVGSIRQWPQSLRSALSICLRSRSPAAVFWGSERACIYNDAWAEHLGERHPAVLGKAAREALPDMWPVIEHQVENVAATAESISMVDALVMRETANGWAESYWTYTLLPVGSEDGSVGGILAQVRETSQAVLRARQDSLLLTLGERLRRARAPQQVLGDALSLLGEHLLVHRLGYCEIDAEGKSYTIRGCWTDGGLPELSGTFTLGRFFPNGAQALARGEILTIADAETERSFDEPLRTLWREANSRSALIVPLVQKDRYTAVLFAHHREPREWTEYEKSLSSGVLDRVWQDFTRAEAEAALRHSEQRYRQIFEGANDLIFSCDLEQRITDANPAAAAAVELTRDELIGRSIQELVSDEAWEQTKRMLRQKLENGGTTRHEIEVRAGSGKRLSLEVNSSLAADREGKIVGVSAIARDVTERRTYEERQRLLVQELNHRVKNMLALVQGLAFQSFKNAQDVAGASAAFQQRLAALAAAHDLLTRESWQGATLTELVRETTAHHRADGRILAAGQEMTLNPKSAVSLVMALHELSTNALKYGALSVPEGRVHIDWDAVPGGLLRLQWTERDGPPVRPSARKGFGFRMIQQALAADLGGKVSIDLAEGGLACRIEAPFARAASELA